MLGIIVVLVAMGAFPFVASAIKSHRDSRLVKASYETYYGFCGEVSFHYPISEKKLASLVSDDIVSKGGDKDTGFKIKSIA